MKLYYITVDHGDGSTGVRWFKNYEKVSKLVDEDDEDYDEAYYGNEGSVRSITLPDDFDTSTLGIRFSD